MKRCPVKDCETYNATGAMCGFHEAMSRLESADAAHKAAVAEGVRLALKVLRGWEAHLYAHSNGYASGVVRGCANRILAAAKEAGINVEDGDAE
jgi:hypothetical protein